MSTYKNKYIKYKQKYLNIQKGGTHDEIIHWPDDYTKIILNDFYEIVMDNGTKEIINNINKKNRDYATDQNKQYGEGHHKYHDMITSGIVNIPARADSLQLSNGKNESAYTLRDFHNGFELKHIRSNNLNDPVNLNDQKKSNESDQIIHEQNKSNDSDQIIHKQNKLLEKLQDRIKKLEEKQNMLEHSLNNHYHILPTSGIKHFEELHPYYNKKID